MPFRSPLPRGIVNCILGVASLGLLAFASPARAQDTATVSAMINLDKPEKVDLYDYRGVSEARASIGHIRPFITAEGHIRSLASLRSGYPLLNDAKYEKIRETGRRST